jgi:CDP-paratose 2-epimerase
VSYFEPSSLTGPVLITGGAGFIGVNLADRLATDGVPVVVFDDLSRRGSRDNLEWLCAKHTGRVRAVVADVRDPMAVRTELNKANFVFHFAAQVAVTTSLEDPCRDFDINARGTLNVLEALRECEHRPGLVYTSTNKVYGALPDVGLHCLWNRYEPDDLTLARAGIGENRRLDFHSPYGCSKGTADQYVLDYARSFGIAATVFRMSCIYGPHQNGTEDQGWVAHFLMKALAREPITIYGDGKQVRDLLFVDDLVNAFLLAADNIERIGGRAFNLGGGPANALSLIELLQLIRETTGDPPRTRHAGWRVGDQRYYVSDTSAFKECTGWKPAVDVRTGVGQLHAWLSEHHFVEARRSA